MAHFLSRRPHGPKIGGSPTPRDTSPWPPLPKISISTVARRPAPRRDGERSRLPCASSPTKPSLNSCLTSCEPLERASTGASPMRWQSSWTTGTDAPCSPWRKSIVPRMPSSRPRTGTSSRTAPSNRRNASPQWPSQPRSWHVLVLDRRRFTPPGRSDPGRAVRHLLRAVGEGWRTGQGEARALVVRQSLARRLLTGSSRRAGS